jgi:ferrochelatase
MNRGLLLINLGTPKNCNPTAIRRYLCEFLIDKRVIDIAWPLRYLFVYGLIAPFRTNKSTHAYQQIWTPQGSPLLINSQNLVAKVQDYLGEDFKVVLGMRYGTPSIETALDQLKECSSITVLPLYPQYSSAATGSSIEKTLSILAKREVIPSLTIIADFYQNQAYIKAQAQSIKSQLPVNHHLLFSYHGIPERQISKSGCTKVCPAICAPINSTNQFCYKAQCYQTSRLLAAELGLSSQQYSTSFQSRLGKIPWIKPYTDEILDALITQGVENLTICCPSFVTDCLETLEEVGLRAKEQWLKLGGKQFSLIPGMNDTSQWVEALSNIITNTN